MIRIAALTSGTRVPSSRYRVRQFIEPLRRLGVVVAEYPLSSDKFGSSPNRGLGRAMTVRKILGRLPGLVGSRGAELTWLERELIPGRRTLEGLTKRPRILDLDDALWLNGRPGFSEAIAERCDGVIAGNDFLADHYRGFAPKVWVVPTSVDTDAWVPRPPQAPHPEWTIGWTGSASTIPFLMEIEKPLGRFLAGHPDARLLVVSDQPPAFRSLPSGRWRFEAWSPESEVRQLHEMDVGLMPLPDTDWSRGKCALKMLLYMATGIPVIASRVGVGGKILARHDVGLAADTPEEWSAALTILYDGRDRVSRMGCEGRRVVETFFSVQANAGRLASAFQEVLGVS